METSSGNQTSTASVPKAERVVMIQRALDELFPSDAGEERKFHVRATSTGVLLTKSGTEPTIWKPRTEGKG